MTVKILFSSFIFLISFISPPSLYAQLPPSELVMKVADTTATAGDAGELSVFIDTYNTEIFGLQFVLKSNRPDLIKFDLSGLGYNVVGTLVENFKYIEVRDKAGDQSEYWFRCIADFDGLNGSQRGIFPQQGGVAVKVPYIVQNSFDTTLSLTSDITFEIPTDFSDPLGNSLGAIPDTLVDTIYYSCTAWDNDVCTSWVQVLDTTLGYDAIVYDSSIVGLLDSTVALVIDGSISVIPPINNNCDGNEDGLIDITDLVCLVDYMFYPNEPSLCENVHCDFDGNSITDISDLVAFVDFMFLGGPPPN